MRARSVLFSLYSFKVARTRLSFRTCPTCLCSACCTVSVPDNFSFILINLYLLGKKRKCPNEKKVSKCKKSVHIQRQ